MSPVKSESVFNLGKNDYTPRYCDACSTASPLIYKPLNDYEPRPKLQWHRRGLSIHLVAEKQTSILIRIRSMMMNQVFQDLESYRSDRLQDMFLIDESLETQLEILKNKLEPQKEIAPDKESTPPDK